MPPVKPPSHTMRMPIFYLRSWNLRRRARVRRAIVAGSVFAFASVGSGCIQDPDCGVCDPDNLVLQIISGLNFANKKIYLVGPECDSSSDENRCKDVDKAEYYVSQHGKCEDSEEAQKSTRPGEYCKLSPANTAFAFEFLFNNLLDADSIELVRKSPANPKTYEIYDWKTRVLKMVGPTTRYRGDFREGDGPDDPDLVTRSINLSCVENLALTQSITVDHELLEAQPDICDKVVDGKPLRMEEGRDIRARGGVMDWRTTGNECAEAQEGPDTCCRLCEYELGVNVARYGVNSLGTRRTPQDALRCDPTGNVYADCVDFVPSINRQDEILSYVYTWDEQPLTDQKITRYDRLRETHPASRPADVNWEGPACTTTSECEDPNGFDLPGTQCIGTLEADAGAFCPVGFEGCTATGRCRAEWFVRCADGPEGEQGFCVDRRHDPKGAMSCYRATADFEACDDFGNCQSKGRGRRLSECNGNGDTKYTVEECCQESLGWDPDADPTFCDPIFQENVAPVSRFDRDYNLPDEAQECVCVEKDEANDTCRGIVETNCYDQYGKFIPERRGEYALKFVRRPGGVVYDGAVKGIAWRPADTGNVTRTMVEACAERGGQIEPRNVKDGWLENDVSPGALAETFDDFDRALCSGQDYEIHFGMPGQEDVQVLRDKVGNTLEGRDIYRFSTPQFHIVPESGFPQSNLRVGACSEFLLEFSNRFDMSPQNLKKVALYEVDVEVCRDQMKAKTEGTGTLIEPAPQALDIVAGGPGCTDDPQLVDAATPPCLTINVAEQFIGTLRLEIDSSKFTTAEAKLKEGHCYGVYVPGLNGPSEIDDPNKYAEAFWDVCGMPLVKGGAEGDAQDYVYQFIISEPKCREDLDGDGIPLSCDNDKDHFNPSQDNVDGDNYGDTTDLCPTVPSAVNSADADTDGVGNDCDNCRLIPSRYFDDAGGEVASNLMPRNIPYQSDFDGDGIGDVCDNCITVANCESYGPTNPWHPGAPISVENANTCQQKHPMFPNIGQACIAGDMPIQGVGAAGPVGFGDTDDLDQDGLPNVQDGCPRQPVSPRIECTMDADCPADQACTVGVCNHVDSDNDNVGHECDTCPYNANGEQLVNPDGDDPDGDFVGNECELGPRCIEISSPRRYAFYDKQANGYCCTQLYPGDGVIRDPYDVPVTMACDPSEEEKDPEVEMRVCRQLQQTVIDQPGMVSLPEGCTEAGAPITLEDVGNDSSQLLQYMCFLPPWDTDFDGLADVCDACAFAYDPYSLPYIDANNKVWPLKKETGKYCAGVWDPEEVGCPDDDETGGTGTGGETGGTGMGGTDAGTGAGTGA